MHQGSDLLPNPTNAQLVATGFHRNTQINQEGGAKDEENRVNAVIDRVNTTGAVWLGSTLACAQCHTHKYDPVAHVEYYRMLAFFDQTQDGGVSTGPSVQVTDEESAPLLAEFESERARLDAALDAAERAAASGCVRWTPTLAEGPELRIAADASFMSWLTTRRLPSTISRDARPRPVSRRCASRRCPISRCRRMDRGARRTEASC